MLSERPFGMCARPCLAATGLALVAASGGLGIGYLVQFGTDSHYNPTLANEGVS